MISVSKGDTILTSLPFAYILKGNLRGLHCDHCLRKKNGLQRCSGCACSYYCNKDCQKSDWEIHKNECRSLKRLKSKLPPDTARLIARIIFKLKNGGYDIEEKITEVKSRTFKDLMNHSKNIKEDKKCQEHFTSLVVVLQSYLGEENIPCSEELFDIYGRVCVNSFTITDKNLNGVGVGIYLAASIFDHSCMPNLYASFNGTKLVMKSLYDRPYLDWDKLRISYIDVMNTKEHRKKELEDGYYFTCDCILCTETTRENIMFSINCGNSKCLSPVYVDDKAEPDIDSIDPCSKCGFCEYPSGTRRDYLETVVYTKEKLQEMKNKNCLDLLKSLIEKQEPLFHSLNLWRSKSLDAAFEASINERSWEDAISFGCESLEGLKFYYGSNHPMYAMCLLKLGKIELYLFKLEEAHNHLMQAKAILEVTHGKNNPIYFEDLTALLKQAKQEIEMVQGSGFNLRKKPNLIDNTEAIMP